MGRKSKAKFTMKGHTLPGINQKSETANIKDGRSPSSAFQMQQPGDSPLQKGFWGKALNVATGGLAGGIGKALKGDWKGAAGSVLSGGMSSFGGGGGGMKDKMKAKVDEKLDEKVDEALSEDSAMAMKSPNKKKLKTGTKTTIGGKLNEGTSPHQNL
jgi:hypothetical protein